ncbi:putative transporter [Pseudocercospora fuligena]|uniref:Putative transporter n=1 Tax=Pseudocercospora fuligena TaxID=685502 RepID=A0A8H6VR49_9PEZI|nr:putative transporter [Pseudocercospora fuligena]
MDPEKLPQTTTEQVPTPLHDLDQAHGYLQSHAEADVALDSDIDRITRKVDWVIIPLLFLCFGIQGMDKQVISYAAVMGLQKDLKLQGEDYSNAASALFIASLVFEFPNIYIINKVPPAKWLAGNCVLWGIATACMAATHNAKSLIACRVFIGIFEAAVYPATALIIGQYYRKDKSGVRFMFMGVSIGATIIIGALLSYGFQHVHGTALAGWRILCLLLGLLSSALGFVLWIFLPDTPMKARFLNESEKFILLRHISVNKTGVRSTTFRIKHLLELVSDPQVWMFTILNTAGMICTGFTLSYVPQIIATFGFSKPNSALLSAPGGLVSMITNLVVGALLNTPLPRAAVVSVPFALTFVAGCLLTFAPRSNRAASLAGVYLVNCGPVTFIAIYHWVSANVAGHTKRPAVMAIVTAGFCAGSLIGPQTFRAHEAPEYRSAKITLLSTQAAMLVLTLAMGLYYWAINKSRDVKYGKSGLLSCAGADLSVWENLTDRERHSFRYMS